MLRQLTLVAILLLNAAGLFSQSPSLYESNGTAVLDEGSPLHNAWAGGMLHPQFSNIDLNNDGKQDLFVFDRADNRALTFVYESNGIFRYAPEYEVYFPEMFHWALLVDYNADGKPDIFTYSATGAAIDIYRNVSTNEEVKFVLEVRELYYHEPTFDLNLYVNSYDIPSIIDLDNDGDLDILAFDVGGTLLQHYRNNSMELYGIPDSLDYSIVDRCWGKFTESATDNSIVLGKGCGTVKKRKKHGGSTLLAFDADGDGDKDLLTGDVSYDNLVYLENGRIRSGFSEWPRDTIVSVSYNYPASHPAKVSLYPGAFLVDINNDNLLDLVVSPMAKSESLTRKQILQYHNTGTSGVPVFSYQGNDFLQATMIDGGTYSAPAFWDFNGDGLKDMALAVQGNAGAGYYYSRIELYENIGSNKSPVYELVTADFAGVAARETAHLTLTFGDLNGDGRPDMLAGTESGKILHYTNAGIENGIPKMNLVTEEFGAISGRTYITPHLFDINKDGLPDLLTGSYSGTFQYYRNTGTSSSPIMTLENDSFGKVYTNETLYQYEYDNDGKKIDSTLYVFSYGYSAPCITDLDGNGKFDMVSGSYSGELFYYPDIESQLGGTFSNQPEIIFNKLNGDTISKDFGSFTKPAAADLDGDGKAEVVLGSIRGGVIFLGSNPIITSINEPKASGITMYPNPASSTVTIETAGRELNEAVISVFDISGRMVKRNIVNTAANRYTLDIAALKKGLYLVQIATGAGVESQKLIVH